MGTWWNDTDKMKRNKETDEKGILYAVLSYC